MSGGRTHLVCQDLSCNPVRDQGAQAERLGQRAQARRKATLNSPAGFGQRGHGLLGLRERPLRGQRQVLSVS